MHLYVFDFDDGFATNTANYSSMAALMLEQIPASDSNPAVFTGYILFCTRCRLKLVFLFAPLLLSSPTLELLRCSPIYWATL
ncbi:hypothetical protein SAMN04487962_110124 [Marinobacter segnicrescens]|uniref:Uncharacterized protein n=1 Tax=Marinobacter segnicrescens TaxID=430453 RepID=A0A1I0ESR9_9GAMM|nr:hypothetical protein [Marinobacter segnicrescens]SET48288.1 hypothetical protein SAMN04487962_110124 [Marinobacter segnicrescens]